MTRKIWKRENYHVEVIQDDGWQKVFAVVYNDEILYTISPATKVTQDDIIKALDSGEEVVGWKMALVILYGFQSRAFSINFK